MNYKLPWRGQQLERSSVVRATKLVAVPAPFRDLVLGVRKLAIWCYALLPRSGYDDLTRQLVSARVSNPLELGSVHAPAGNEAQALNREQACMLGAVPAVPRNSERRGRPVPSCLISDLTTPC